MDFYCVYIQEAHPDDGWQVPMNVTDDVVFSQPTSDDERARRTSDAHRELLT